jgi:anti-sigma regulatory factor (Ser/Thr protein kinase)
MVMASDMSDELVFGLADLSDLRRLVTSKAIRAGLSSERAADLALAFNEIATNAIVHGTPPATTRVWEEDGEVICEVTDAGSGIDDPHPGQVPPPVDAPGGRGMWLARQLCDRLEVHNGVRCTVSIGATARRPSAVGAF